jgi:hypothetical protein
MVRINYFNYPLFVGAPTFPSSLKHGTGFQDSKEMNVLHDLQGPAAIDAVSEAHRHAYNAAFHALDLNWHWDAVTFAAIDRYGRAGVKTWLELEQPHLLRAYSVDFLVDAVEATKARCLAAYEGEAARRFTDRLAA